MNAWSAGSPSVSIGAVIVVSFRVSRIASVAWSDPKWSEEKMAGLVANAASTAAGLSMRVRSGASRTTAAARISSAYVRAACR